MASMRSRTGRLVLIFGSCTERKRGLHQYAPKLLLFGSRRVGGSFHFLVAPCGMFPHSSVGKESACNSGDPSLIPGSGRSAGEGKGYPLQYSGLENSMDCIVMGSQRVRHDWATFTFTFHVPCGKLVPWPGTELLLNMKYIRPGLGNAAVWHRAFQTKCCFSRGGWWLTMQRKPIVCQQAGSRSLRAVNAQNSALSLGYLRVQTGRGNCMSPSEHSQV